MKNVFNKMSSSKSAVLLILAVVSFIIFFNTIDSSFHLDDFINILDNADVKITELSFESLNRAAASDVAGMRPLPYLTFALNYYFSGVNPAPYHIINIIIHILNAFLIYLIILRLFGSDPREGANPDENAVNLTALFTALIWLTTPLNSQPVIYIVQRMSLMMTLFSLLSFHTYLIAKEKKSIPRYLVATLFFIMSLLSKQNAVTLPLAILAYELVFTMQGDIKNIRTREKVILAAVLLVIALTLALYSGRIYTGLAEGYKRRGFTMAERLLTQPRVIIFYLSLMLLPLPGRLSITYEIAKSTSLVSPVTTLLSIIALIALLAAAIVRMKKSPFFSFAVLWLFIGLSVESTIIPLELVYEHRMYLPAIFLFATGVGVIVKKLHANHKLPLIAVLTTLTIALGGMTIVRGQVWENEFTLWSDVVQKYPDDGRANYNLGLAYAEAGDYKAAITRYRRAINKGNRTTLIHHGTMFKAYNNLGTAYFQIGEAQLRYNKYLQADQNFVKAIKFIEKAVELNANDTLSNFNLGVIHLKRNENSKALEYFNRVIELAPGFALAYKNIGEIHFNNADYDKALANFNMALQYNPNDIVAKSNIQKIKNLLRDK